MRILFMGRKPVAARCLEWLMGMQGVEVVGVLTDSHLDVSPTADVARRHGLRLLNFDEALADAGEGKLSFDLGLSMLYWRRLRGALIEKPYLGVINFHPAPLPDYKGVGGYNLAILEGLDNWQCTAHYVDAEIDTGEIIEYLELPVCPQTETARTLEAKCQLVLEELFQLVLKQVLHLSSRLPTTPNVGGRHLSRKELEAMKAIDPEKDDIARKVRAFWFPPYDGAYIELAGQKFTLADRTILESMADPTVSSLFTPKR